MTNLEYERYVRYLAENSDLSAETIKYLLARFGMTSLRMLSYAHDAWVESA